MSAARSPYIVGRAYDWAFFLSPPILALLLGIGIAGTRFDRGDFSLFGRETTGAALVLGVLVHAHLFAVFFRTHANRSIFRLYPLRFLVVPVVLFAVIRSAPAMGVTAMVVATFWDVWHSAAQTFGLARVYDRNAGNAPLAGRRLDLWINQLLYAGPILAGVTMIDHFDQFAEYEKVDLAALARVPAFMERTHRYWGAAVLIAGAAFVGWYALSYLRLRRAGHRVSPHKVFLIASTGLCSIACWGFNSWGEAFFVMNLVHAVQYLALVWATEHRQLLDRSGLQRFRAGKPVLLFGFGAVLLGYGAFAQLLDPKLETLWTLTIVVSLLHFWYDGFVWSVRRAQV